MINTFEALASFDEKGEKIEEVSADAIPENTANADISSIVARLNALETALNEIKQKNAVAEAQQEAALDVSQHWENNSTDDGSEVTDNASTTDK